MDRVAVVVVAGVGDSPRTDAAERVANGLTKWVDFTTVEEHSEWFLVEEQDEAKEPAIQPVQRFEMRSPNGTEVDVYEFWWADLSRFPAAMRSFLAAFVGLFLALPSIGRTALRDPCAPVTYEHQENPPTTWRRLDFRLLGLVAWLTAVPVVVLSAVLLLVVGAVSVAIALPDSNFGAAAMALYGLVLAVVGLGLLRHYEQGSGRQPVVILGGVAFAAAVGICVWRLVERGVGGNSVDLALADTVTVLVTYPLRILWLAVVAAGLLATIALIVRLAEAGAARRIRRQETVSAIITLGLGPIGLATLMAILSAVVGAAGRKLSESVSWDAATPICLETPDSWYWQHCSGGTRAWDFGVLHLEDSIFALVCASAVTIAVMLVLGVVASLGYMRLPFVRRSEAERVRRQARGVSHVLAVLDNNWTCAWLMLGGVVAAYAAAGAWLRFFWFPDVFRDRASSTPVVAAILGGSVTTLILAGRVMGLSPRSLVTDGLASGALRALLDKPYDIATFLREPSSVSFHGVHFGLVIDRKGRTGKTPRKKMLERFRALTRYLATKGYDRIVFVAHSQGTILTTTLLAEGEEAVPLPPTVSLMTFGCPLRQLYLQRFPAQWAWVDVLADPKQRGLFVKRVNREWVNVAMSGDPIGRTIFCPPPDDWPHLGAALPDGLPGIEELLLGPGGHTTYWRTAELYVRLARMIEG